MIGEDAWMVGVRYRSVDGRLVHHFYVFFVVDGVTTASQACHAAG
ncbi:hypothetical protein ACIP2X_05550 [Streptomyces sp. NPDC089424]